MHFWTFVTRSSGIRHKTHMWPIHSSQTLPSPGSLVTKPCSGNPPSSQNHILLLVLVTKSSMPLFTEPPFLFGVIRRKPLFRLMGSSQNPFYHGWFVTKHCSGWWVRRKKTFYHGWFVANHCSGWWVHHKIHSTMVDSSWRLCWGLVCQWLFG